MDGAIDHSADVTAHHGGEGKVGRDPAKPRVLRPDAVLERRFHPPVPEFAAEPGERYRNAAVHHDGKTRSWHRSDGENGGAGCLAAFEIAMGLCRVFQRIGLVDGNLDDAALHHVE
jgi:hypothetical protein